MLLRMTLLRGDRGWSQKTLASHLGCQREEVSYWETGARQPTPARLAQIAALLGCDETQLLDPVEPPPLIVVELGNERVTMTAQPMGDPIRPKLPLVEISPVDGGMAS